MGDHQAARKVIEAGGPMRLMHPRHHRIHTAAISEQFTQGLFMHIASARRTKPLTSVLSALQTH
eukprot:9273814-Pyramimonas_sp.AAC.1